MSEQTALATRQSGALATYQGADEKDFSGKENINQNDVKLPFLAIAQKTSPEIEPGHAREIPGLRFLGMFNSITREIVQGPIEFLPIILKKHAIEFNPYDEGGGIKDRNVAWDDPRCDFNGDEKPVATRFYDWAILNLATMELIVLSMKSTNITVAKMFQQLVQVRKGPAFAGKYTVEVVKGDSPSGPFGKFKISAAGAPTTEQYEYAKALFEGIKDQNITTNHEADTAEVPVAGRADAPAPPVTQPAPGTSGIPF